METREVPTVIGNHVSPFVRKVLAVARLKGIVPLVDPIVPFFGVERFDELSPLRRIPVLIDGPHIVLDSTVIAEYLEDVWPTPSILPGSAAERASSRWFDELADTRVAQVFLWGVFGKSVIRPGIFGEARDLDAIRRHMDEDVPPIMDLLERLAPAEGFIAGDVIGLGDISIATQFANLRWARQTLDASRWPRTLAWVARAEAHDALKALTELGAVLVRKPPRDYRETLRAAGVPLTPDTLAGDTPKRAPVSQA